VLRASPNAAHFAIARLADFVLALTVVTQNVDDLHERAGSTGVIHLHGSLHSPQCMDCGAAFEMLEAVPDLPLEGQRVQPPRCKGCDGFVCPGVVWFGEMLPENNWSAAVAAAEASDMFLSIGTSGIVYPAAELPLRALCRGSTVVHINPVPLELTAAEYMLQME